MGMIKGMWKSGSSAAKGSLNKLEANFLGAKENHLFLGTHAQRDQFVGGKNTVFEAHAQAKKNKAMFADMEKDIAETAKANPRNLSAEDLKKWQADEMSALGDLRSASREQYGSDLIAGASEMGSAAWGHITGADRAGQGWGRTAAVATRIGVPVAGAMAVGTVGRYATGGSFTQNRKGERDIAGVPFI